MIIYRVEVTSRNTEAVPEDKYGSEILKMSFEQVAEFVKVEILLSDGSVIDVRQKAIAGDTPEETAP
jgi:hypothetical protein